MNPGKAPGPMNVNQNAGISNKGVHMIISPRDDTSTPITVEVQQGTTSQIFALPENSLDPTKNYYVSLSIKPASTPIKTVTSRSSLGNNSVPPPEESGALSAPPDTVEPTTIVTQ